MHTKKGISAVVATVLIILITIAAIIILWATLMPLIQYQLKGESECLKAIRNLDITRSCRMVNFTTPPSTLGSLTTVDFIGFVFNLKRGPEKFDLKDIQIGMEGYRGDKITLIASEWAVAMPSVGFPGSISELPSPNGAKTYSLDFCDNMGGCNSSGEEALAAGAYVIQKVSIAPIINIDGRTKMCKDIVFDVKQYCPEHDNRHWVIPPGPLPAP